MVPPLPPHYYETPCQYPQQQCWPTPPPPPPPPPPPHHHHNRPGIKIEITPPWRRRHHHHHPPPPPQPASQVCVIVPSGQNYASTFQHAQPATYYVPPSEAPPTHFHNPNY